MRSGKNSAGISYKASALEDKLGLREESFCQGSLDFALDKLAIHFNVTRPTLRMGRKAVNRRAYYKIGESEITINTSGWSIATLLHEFSHHLQCQVDKFNDGHGKRFKTTHEEVLFAFGYNFIDGLTYDRLNLVEELESLADEFPSTYDSLYEDDISVEDMLAKMKESLAEVLN